MQTMQRSCIVPLKTIIDLFTDRPWIILERGSLAWEIILKNNTYQCCLKNDTLVFCFFVYYGKCVRFEKMNTSIVWAAAVASSTLSPGPANAHTLCTQTYTSARPCRHTVHTHWYFELATETDHLCRSSLPLFLYISVYIHPTLWSGHNIAC